jgi:hypothetical protein
MRGRYFRDMSIVRAGGDNNVPAPEENEVVIYGSFFKAGFRFPLSKFVVEVLKRTVPTTTSVIMDLSLALTQGTRCQHFGRDGPELGWKNGFM